MKMRLVFSFALAVLSLANRADAQGLLLDTRPVPIGRSYEIREVDIDARVRDQVAEVRVAQTFYNPGSTVIEAQYLFPLPDEGAIENVVLMVDGKELPGRLMAKEEARRIYEEIVRARKDPALVEYMGRGLFRTSVFPIPPGAERKVILKYTQLCKKEREIVEFAYPLGTQKFSAKPIGSLRLNVEIRSKDAIKSVYCPSDDAEVKRRDDHEASIRFERRNIQAVRDFRAVYTLAEGALSATVLSYKPESSEDGYFLVLASPEVKAADAKPQPKTVIFVLDRSGSMAGKKIEQARNALVGVLNNLRNDDLFNIIVYDDRVESFKPELLRYTSETRAEAERYVQNIREGGSTNIDGALKKGLGMLTSDDRPNYVLFLTDGLPTAGETGEMGIFRNAKEANKVRARLFAFGVGFDVNARLLDRLSGGNGGVSEYVKPDENLEKSLGRFSSKLTSPALASLRVEMVGTDLNRTYPRDIPDLFDGGQLVWVGRYRQSGPTKLRLTGKVGTETRTFEFPAELASTNASDTHQYVEKVWAIRRVGDIIDQIDLNGANKELTDELVALSKKYGILTPYTSFLADERVDLHAQVELRGRATEQLARLSEVSGASGVSQRGLKQSLNQAQNASSSSFEIDSTGPVAAAAAPSSLGMGGAFAGRMGAGGRGGIEGMALGQPVGGANRPTSTLSVKAGGAPQPTMRQVGAKTFFRRNNRWIDADVKPEEEAKAIVIEQFTDDYFKVANSQPATSNQYLTFEDEVLVKLDGKVYQVNRASR